MIKFKQKNYFWGLAINGGMTALTAGSMIQAHNQGKEQEQQAEVMQQQMKQQNRALEKIAKNAAKNPQAAQQVVSTMEQRNQSAYSEDGRIKLFGIAGNAAGLAKDVGKAIWNRRGFVGSGLAFAVPTALAAYGADKYIQHDLKKRGQPVTKPQEQQKAYGIASVVGKVGKTASATLGKTLGKHTGSIIAGIGFGGGIPLLSYVADKKAAGDQIKQSQSKPTTALPTQKNYASISGIVKGLKSGWKSFKAHPGQSVLGGMSSFAGGGGKSGVDNLAKEFKQSKNLWTQKVGGFIEKHPKTALTGGIGVGIATTFPVWSAGENITRKGLEKIDKNAFAYEKMQNQQVK